MLHCTPCSVGRVRHSDGGASGNRASATSIGVLASARQCVEFEVDSPEVKHS